MKRYLFTLMITIAAAVLLVGCGGGGDGGGGDTTPPSVPLGLDPTPAGPDAVLLSWASSTDNVGVAGYKIFRDGTQVGTSATNAYPDTGLTPSSSYAYTVAAYDAAGNTSDQSAQQAATTEKKPYLFYTANDGLGNISLHAVDPDNPAAPIPVEATGLVDAGKEEILSGLYDPAKQQLIGSHIQTLVYAKTDGMIYKVSTQPTVTPTPVQISNETGAAAICDSDEEPDFGGNHGNSVYGYSLPGADTTCFTSDDVWKGIRLNMTSVDSPIDFSALALQPVTTLRDMTNAAIVGWIAVDHSAGTLVECTADFTDCSTTIIGTTVLNVGSIGIDLNSGAQAIWVYDGTNYDVYTYDAVSSTLSSSLYSSTTPLQSDDFQDATAAYFGEGPQVIKKISFSGPTVTTVVDETATTQFIVEAQLTDTRLVYVTADAAFTTITIKSVPKAGGASTPLVSATSPDNFDGLIFSRNKVFYNKTSSGTDYAGYILDDGSASAYEVPDAQWTAMAASSTMNAAADFTITRLIRSHSDATVWSFDPAAYSSTSTGIQLGTMPSGEGMYSMYGGGLGNHMIGVGFNTAGLGDIFYFEPDVAGSIVRVTSTSAVNEHSF